MKDIKLIDIHLKNFRSFNDEKIEFSQSVGLKMLSGENKREPRLGSNGAGKSTLWNGVCWICYGSGLKGERTSDLISWGEASSWGELSLQNGGITHTITRSGPPARIQIDGQPATQTEIDTLLGLSKLRFIHSVIFGQAVRLFPDLTVPERGELFDEVLNLDIWNKASDLASKKHSAIEKQLIEKKNALAYIEGNINGLPTEESIQSLINTFELEREILINEHKTNANGWEINQQEKITAAQQQFNAWENEQNQALEKLADQIDKQEIDKQQIIDRISWLNQELASVVIEDASPYEQAYKVNQQKYYQLVTKRKREFDDSQFWEKNNNCPTCEQTIDLVKKNIKLCEFKQKIADLDQLILITQAESLEAASKVEKINNLKDDWIRNSATLREELKSRDRELRSLNRQILDLENQAKSLVTKLESNANPWSRQIQVISLERNPYLQQILNIQEQANPHINTLNLTRQKRQGLELSRQAEQAVCLAFQSKLTIAEYWKQGFKRIRLFFVKRILAALQVEIQSAISALGLNQWYISLTTETENKSGGIKLGIAIHVKSPIAEGHLSDFSGGESQRLRLGIAMGLANLVQRAAGVRYNTLVFDEPTMGLSVEGIDDLLDCLDNYAQGYQKSVWIIDHRAIDHSAFVETWTVIKSEEGSKLFKN